jgi:hypothetical protein
MLVEHRLLDRRQARFRAFHVPRLDETAADDSWHGGHYAIRKEFHAVRCAPRTRLLETYNQGVVRGILLALLAFVSRDDIVGRPAAAWGELRWIQGGPLRLEDLRGHVVLLRFFMSAECPTVAARHPRSTSCTASSVATVWW